MTMIRTITLPARSGSSAPIILPARSRSSAPIIAVAASLWIAIPGDADACDRMSMPYDQPVLAVAVADVVAVVEVTATNKGVATAKLVDVLKGGDKDVAKGKTIDIKGPLSLDEVVKKGHRCGVDMVEVKKQYIAMLWSPLPGALAFQLVNPGAGLPQHDATQLAVIQKALAANQPVSGWKRQKTVATRLVVDPVAASGELDLTVIVRNTSKTAIDWSIKAWPEAEQTKCDLDMFDAGGQKKVAAKDSPISRQAIADYFSKQRSGAFKRKVEPGETVTIRLDRVTTAKQGWGYKEELGFRFYPTGAGLHAVSVTCSNFLGPGTKLATDTLDVMLK